MIVKKWTEALEEMVQKVLFRLKLWEMDEWWYFTGASSWALFPPSFFYKHTEEEVRRIKAETIEMLRKLMRETEE